MNRATISANLEKEAAHFLATGESDPLGRNFPGRHAPERLVGYVRHLRNALFDEVRRRERGRRQNHTPPDFNPTAWTRCKVEPMIAGLFPAPERQVVLGVAERSIVFLTRETAHRTLREVGYLGSAWTCQH